MYDFGPFVSLGYRRNLKSLNRTTALVFVRILGGDSDILLHVDSSSSLRFAWLPAQFEERKLFGCALYRRQLPARRVCKTFAASRTGRGSVTASNSGEARARTSSRRLTRVVRFWSLRFAWLPAQLEESQSYDCARLREDTGG